MELLTIEEVADRLRVSVLTVRWLRQEGRRQCGGLKVLFRGRRVACLPDPSSPCGDTRPKASVPLFKEASIPI